LLRSDTGRRQPIDHDRGDMIEPEILQQQRTAQVVEQTGKIALTPVRINPQAARMPDAAA